MIMRSTPSSLHSSHPSFLISASTSLPPLLGIVPTLSLLPLIPLFVHVFLALHIPSSSNTWYHSSKTMKTFFSSAPIDVVVSDPSIISADAFFICDCCMYPIFVGFIERFCYYRRSSLACFSSPSVPSECLLPLPYSLLNIADDLEYIFHLDPFGDSGLHRLELPMIREARLRVLVVCTIFHQGSNNFRSVFS
ncbi:hypothetical protein F3Y22_tig00000916pilonHSYRG00331 [Hibiscus syriacus]|uniref:Uncharacterized protein n=1 Tax=Hibiscus syriacus TaxID=106335 RepID=A0A6A3D298_HIBSY|nr:hypothetical protein F3Y22_tig00000916pilonHSYRG00331 [Hibiscus syriacus]